MRKSSLFHKISAVLLLVFFFTPVLSLKGGVKVHAENEVKITVHYAREDGSYEGWNLWIWEEGGQGQQVDFTEEDDFGKVAKLSMSSEKENFGFIVRKGNWAEKDIDGDRFFDIENGEGEIWLKSGEETVYRETPAMTAEEPSALEGELLLHIHYRRFDDNYDGWNLWIWPEGGEGEAYDFNSEDDFGKLQCL